MKQPLMGHKSLLSYVICVKTTEKQRECRKIDGFKLKLMRHRYGQKENYTGSITNSYRAIYLRSSL